MDAERWRRINALFHAAREHPHDRREAFVDEACAGEPALRDEVLSLLRMPSGPGVVDRSAVEADPELLLTGGDDPLIGRRLGPYEVTAVLGRGGMGIVYLGHDTRIRRPVAIKALPAALTRDERSRARLRREAMAAGAISHPGVATVFALETFDGRLYLVQEYVPGRTLRTTMKLHGGRMAIAEVLAIAGDVARALAAAHAHGVAHGDIKPDNVLHAPDGGMKVVDFGLARFESGGGDAGPRTRPGARPGTPGYMAPEVLRGDPVDARADRFAFGVLLHELLTGAHPFAEGGDVAAVARRLRAPHTGPGPARPACPEPLVRIVAACLAEAPGDRYPHTAALVAALEAVSAVLETGAGAEASPAGAGEGRGAAGLRWWWQFHQAAVSVVYALLLYPVWRAREWLPGPWGLLAFMTAVAVVVAAVNLRLHLWFTARVYPAQLAAQRRASARWKRLLDTAFAVLLASLAAAVAPGHPRWAAFFIVMAVSGIVAARVIEPATTRAAFPDAGPRRRT